MGLDPVTVFREIRTRSEAHRYFLRYVPCKVIRLCLQVGGDVLPLPTAHLILYENETSRVSDPHRFNADPDTDPDPEFFLIADPDS